MSHWSEEWGEKPRRTVRPYWWSPSLILRQVASALYLGRLTGWRGLPRWFLTYGFKCLPGAAGSRGMGCIGFPAHPVWEMTTACNLDCIHCHTSGGKPAPDELSTDEAKLLLDQLATIPEFRMMAFTGGEPLLRDDLVELLAYSQALGFTNTIATNAVLVDDVVAKRLKRYGVVIAAVSLDGFDEETHDRVRGQPGAFDKTIEGMRALRRAGILLHINITAMEYNMEQMEPLMTLVDELGTGPTNGWFNSWPRLRAGSVRSSSRWPRLNTGRTSLSGQGFETDFACAWHRSSFTAAPPAAGLYTSSRTARYGRVRLSKSVAAM